MESGRFTRFSENGLIGKPDILRGFCGCKSGFVLGGSWWRWMGELVNNRVVGLFSWVVVENFRERLPEFFNFF